MPDVLTQRQVARRWRESLRRTAWRVSTLKRVRGCGWRRVAPKVSVLLGPERARFRGVEHCGSVWACPCCSGQVRSARAVELDIALRRHLELGGGAEFLTLTIPHHSGDALRPLFDGLTKAWNNVVMHRLLRQWRGCGKLLGYVRAVEVTHGENGWHPHLHVLVLTDGLLSELDRAAFVSVVTERWQSGVVRAGWSRPSDEHGVVNRPVTDVRGISQYVTKIDGVGWEVVGSAAKRAGRHGRTPWEILDGAARCSADAELWREYEVGTLGRRALVWSKGLRDYLGLNVEATDDELADPVVGADEESVAELGPVAWEAVVANPWGRCMVLEGAEHSGAEGVAEALRWLSEHPPGWDRLSAWVAPQPTPTRGSEPVELPF